MVATDAPLLPHQLKRIAKRAGMGLARMGSYAGNGSGDIFVAFSTANADAATGKELNQAQFVGNDHLDGIVRGDRAGDRGSDRQRHGRRARHARRRRSLRQCHSA